MLPAFAVCPITGGACAAPVNFEPQPLQEKVAPNNLQNMQRTDAFQKDFIKPYDSNTIHTETTSRPQSQDYNSNCQFGVCLPGKQTTQNN